MAPSTRHTLSKQSATAASATPSPEKTYPKMHKGKKTAAVSSKQPKLREISPRVLQNGAKRTVAARHKLAQKRAMTRLRAGLVRRLDSEDQEKLALDQAQLLRRASIALAGEGLGLPLVLDAAANTDMLAHAQGEPASTSAKPGRRGRHRKNYVDVGEILDLDTDDELGVSARHIPQIGLRRRVGRKPAGVLFGIWMAYQQLDDYVYRRSLSDEEIAALPFDDDVFEFHNGGEAPDLPAGFAWDDKMRLVDRRPEVGAVSP